MIVFKCPLCDANVRVDDAHAGKQGRCPGCRGRITVPPAAQRSSVQARPDSPQTPRSTPPPLPQFPPAVRTAAGRLATGVEPIYGEPIEEPKSHTGLWIGLSVTAAVLIGGIVITMFAMFRQAADVSGPVVADRVQTPVIPKRTSSSPQAARAIKALNALAASADDGRTRQLIRTHEPLAYARFGEKGNALAAAKDYPSPLGTIPILLAVAKAQHQSGDGAAVATTLDEAIDVAMQMPEGRKPSGEQWLMRIAMACAQFGDGAGAIRATDGLAGRKPPRTPLSIANRAGRLRRHGSEFPRPDRRGQLTPNDWARKSGLKNTDTKSVDLSETGFILECAGARSAAGKVYVRLVKSVGSGPKSDIYALAAGIAGLIRCGQYDTASKTLRRYAKDHPWRASLGREIALAQARSGDSKGAMKTARYLGDIVLVSDMKLAAGDKAGAISGYKSAVNALKPPVPTRDKRRPAIQKRLARVGLLAEIGLKQARAGAKTDAEVTFEKAIAQTNVQMHTAALNRACATIANAQLAGGLEPGPFPSSATRTDIRPNSSYADVVEKIKTTQGFMPYTRLMGSSTFWGMLGSVQFRKGDLAGARESYSRCMEGIKESKNISFYKDALADVVVGRVEAGDVKGAAAMIAARPKIPLPNSTLVYVANALADKGDHRIARKILKRLDPEDRNYDYFITSLAKQRLACGDLKGALVMIPPGAVGNIHQRSSMAKILRTLCAQGRCKLAKPYAPACSGSLLVELVRIVARKRKADAAEMLRAAIEARDAASKSPEQISDLCAIAREMAAMGKFKGARNITRSLASKLKWSSARSQEERVIQAVTPCVVEMLAGKTNEGIDALKLRETPNSESLLIVATQLIAGSPPYRPGSLGYNRREEIDGPGDLFDTSLEFISRIHAAAEHLEPGPIATEALAPDRR